MGIPGLSRPLESYAVHETIGCKALGCEIHHTGQPSKIVIDGPSFAYCIYHRLIREKPDWLNAVESIPSYDELGNGALTFLDELESYGVVIERIYFDGFLPAWKRSTRVERLEASLQSLFEYHQKHLDASGCKRRWDGLSQPTSFLRSGSRTPSTFRGIPPAGFIVPAILDAIRDSKYAAICFVIPDEAEVYCAAAAKDSGAIILSNDSDLFVHDLGSHGAFVYLSSIDLHTNGEVEEGLGEECRQTLRLSVFRPRDIAARLGLDNLQQLAYEYQKRHSQTLAEALESAKRHQAGEHEGFQSFLRGFIREPYVSENQQFSHESLARLSGSGRLLDPRLSEVVCQLESDSQRIAHAYLLCLIEDPARSSAWHASSSHRHFAYSICSNHTQPLPSKTVIAESTRRGRYFITQDVPLLPQSDIIDYASHLRLQLTQHSTRFAPLLPQPLIWRLYALSHVYRWYLNTARTPPPREVLTRAMTGNQHPRPQPTWDDIHLSAQIQAVLYSLRMIKQIIAYATASTSSAATTTTTALDESLLRLAETLATLPDIAGLMPSPFELAAQTADLDIDDALDGVAAILSEEAAGSPGAEHRDWNNGGVEGDDDDEEDTCDEIGKGADSLSEKKRQESKKKEKKKRKKKKAAGGGGKVPDVKVRVG